MNEHYHSHHGAIQESQHIFINSGLKFIAKRKKEISVFEMGMGTGLNVLATYLFQQKKNIKLRYYTIEKYPLSEEEINQLNYPYLFDTTTGLESIFHQIHRANWHEKIAISDSFMLFKIQEDLLKYNFKNKFDIIYFDAFAPDVQKDLWSIEVFTKLYDSLNQEGMLVTYCVKGTVRRTLKEVGFNVEKLKGPEGGKREILRATKNE